MTVTEILQQLTLEEKIALGSGENFWQTKALPRFGLPALFMCDGPHGLRKQRIKADAGNTGVDMLGINASIPATCYPTASLTACSWDVALLTEMGDAIGKEAAALGVGLVLGPGANMKRDPRCGRNFEYFSEDPHLAGKLAAAWIRGVQQNGVGTSLKHFAANSQETQRFLSDSKMTPRTLRETYLPAFETAVREAQPATVMCAYNQINGTYCAHNHMLLNEILRDEWGFAGAVVTDWGALHDRTASYAAGCDLAMPGGSGYGEADAAQAVRTGRLDMAAVDAAAARVLQLMVSAAPLAKNAADQLPTDMAAAHHEVAAKVAAGSMVLLKNQNNLLPLAADTRVALIGHMAASPRYQGAGSSHINPTRLDTLRHALPHAVYAAGCNADGSTDDTLLAQAAAAAKDCDVAVICAGLPDAYESEGFDRQSLQMPAGHIALINTVAAANPNTVVVLCCGAAVQTPWLQNVQGLIYAGLAGQAGAAAIADILTGRVNPSGRLAESWPLSLADVPAADYGSRDAACREGVFIGYRHYETAGIPVQFAFGSGLSYTSFAYSDLTAGETAVTVTVTNTGSRAGAEVVQLYIAPPAGALRRPVRQLAGFAKVYLTPGESRTVTLPLTPRSFAVWADGWRVPKGIYTLTVGTQSAALAVDGEDLPAETVDEDIFSATPRTLKKGRLTMEHTLAELKDHSLVMRIVYMATIATVKKGLPKGTPKDAPEFRMMAAASTETPLACLISSAGMPPQLFEGLLHMANGHLVKGIAHMMKKA